MPYQDKYKKTRSEKYVIYARKSTEDEERQIRSIGDQIDDCKEIAKDLELDYDESEIIQESRSARKMNNRPEFLRMIDGLKSGKWGGIIAWHPDRLSRNAYESGVIVQMLDDKEIIDMEFPNYRFHNDSTGKEHLAMEFARSKGYSDHLSDSVKRGMKNTSKDGKWVFGKPKFGYRKIRQSDKVFDPNRDYVVPHETDFYLLRHAFEMRLEHRSYTEIAKWMNENGASQKITKQKLQKYLSDPYYYGRYIVHRKSGETDKYNLPELYDFQPVISEEDWLEVQKVNKARSQGRAPRKKWPLAGKVICSACGNVRYPNAPGNKGIVHFTCQTKGCNEKGGANMKNVIYPTIQKVLANGLKFNETDYKKYLYAFKKYLGDEEVKIEYTKRSTISKREHAKKERGIVMEQMASIAHKHGEIEEEIYKNLSQKAQSLKKAIKGYDERLTELNQDDASLAESFEDFLELSRNAYSYWKMANMDKKRQIAEILFSNLVVSKQKVVSLTLNEPFETWIQRKNVLSGRGDWTRTSDLTVPNRAH